ncbi:MAG: hypothetical protein IJE23_00880 [Tyzzerella sp.]|nr:hypothetical protein [Tyzzerella sp.]
MLKKLLKYDFISVFKYWWIAALSSFVLSFVGGGCITVLNTDRELPQIVYPFTIIGLILVILSFVVFSILSVILVYVRFYKNFFTDEGYLTFTLPVKRTQLLNSKLIMGVSTIFITATVCIINVLIMVCIGFSDTIFSKFYWEGFGSVINAIIDELGAYLIIYVIEVFVIVILSVIFSALFIFCCITFASIITKKAKVITAIGIYYVANGIFSFVGQMFYLFGITSLAGWLSELPAGSEYGVIALILLGLICFFGVFCTLLYTLQYWMIDRKLNLS